MSAPIDDGGPAFPTENERQTGPHSYHWTGMTLRDWFAGKALTSMNYDWFDSFRRSQEMAEEAYNIADAMLAARNKPEAEAKPSEPVNAELLRALKSFVEAEDSFRANTGVEYPYPALEKDSMAEAYDAAKAAIAKAEGRAE